MTGLADAQLVNMFAHNMMWIVGGLIAITAIIFTTLGTVARTKAREQTRREIAAYIAEGSMTPEQGERLIKAKADEDD